MTENEPAAESLEKKRGAEQLTPVRGVKGRTKSISRGGQCGAKNVSGEGCRKERSMRLDQRGNEGRGKGKKILPGLVRALFKTVVTEDVAIKSMPIQPEKQPRAVTREEQATGVFYSEERGCSDHKTLIC